VAVARSKGHDAAERVQRALDRLLLYTGNKVPADGGGPETARENDGEPQGARGDDKDMKD